jgi:hypothetical protein
MSTKMKEEDDVIKNKSLSVLHPREAGPTINGTNFNSWLKYYCSISDI